MKQSIFRKPTPPLIVSNYFDQNDLVEMVRIKNRLMKRAKVDTVSIEMVSAVSEVQSKWAF